MILNMNVLAALQLVVRWVLIYVLKELTNSVIRVMVAVSSSDTLVSIYSIPKTAFLHACHHENPK